MGYPSAAVGTRSCWWPGGSKRSLGMLGTSMLGTSTLGTSTLLFTAPLCKWHRHFLLSVLLLIRSTSTSPFDSWSHFHPHDFSPSIAPPRTSPGVTQPRSVPFLCGTGGSRYLLLQAGVRPAAACWGPSGLAQFSHRWPQSSGWRRPGWPFCWALG